MGTLVILTRHNGAMLEHAVTYGLVFSVARDSAITLGESHVEESALAMGGFLPEYAAFCTKINDASS